MFTPSVFFLGSTGFLGSQLLIYLARDLPQCKIVALVRKPSAQKEAQLKEIYKDISIVEGTLDDDEVIQEQAAKADIVINAASSDHFPSVKSILVGLKAGSASKPGIPPLFIHISGLGITSDNCRGEYVDPTKVPVYTDIGLNLEDCPPTNMHLDSDKAIVAAGTAKENPIRTIIVFPGWMYGIGEGIQKTTLPVRIFLKLYRQLGFAGTWGPGLNTMNNVHVKDVARACVAVLKAALEGKADEGADGFYFAASMERQVTIHEWAAKVGDILYEKGMLSKGGSQVMPEEVVAPLGHYGWSLLGGNLRVRPQRLARLGWEATESRKISIMESLPVEVDMAIEQTL